MAGMATRKDVKVRQAAIKKSYAYPIMVATMVNSADVNILMNVFKYGEHCVTLHPRWYSLPACGETLLRWQNAIYSTAYDASSQFSVYEKAGLIFV